MILLVLLAAAGLQAPLPLAATDRFQEPRRLLLRGLDLDTRQGLPALPPALAWSENEAEEQGRWILQAAGPAEAEELAREIRRRDGRVLAWIPHNAWLAWLPPGAAPSLAPLAVFRMPVQPVLKLDRRIGAFGTRAADPEGRHLLSVEFWPDVDPAGALPRLEAAGAEVLGLFEAPRSRRALVRAPHGALLALARVHEVQWITEALQGEPRNDRTRWIIQTARPDDTKVWDLGITGLDVTLGHIDGRIAEDTCWFDDPTGVDPGPTHRKIKWWSPGSGVDAHGTHTAGTAAGNRTPVDGLDSGNGMAPDAFLVHHSGFPSSTELGVWLEEAHQQGARIHTNSWGSSFSTDYDEWARDIDAYSHDREDGLVVFASNNGQNIKIPENAKSCVAVIAADSARPNQIAVGGQGPTADGRLKPEVVAPGCDVWSANTSGCTVVPDCGTSMACPAVAGAAALVKQYFEDGFWPSGAADPTAAFTPSGSLLRACLINSAVDLRAEPGYPSYREGWGRILLDRVLYFAGDPRSLWVVDVPHASGLATGESQSWTLDITAPSPDLRVTLAFADEPGAAFALDPVVNDLELVVTAPDGTVYHGNILNTANGASRPNPDPSRFDHRNTAEMVQLPRPAPGTWTLEVRGHSVPVGPQGFALVATW